MLQKFSRFDADHNGEISYDEFREALSLPDSSEVDRLFHLLDTDESGIITLAHSPFPLPPFPNPGTLTH